MAFDPSKPFTVVSSPQFNPNKPFKKVGEELEEDIIVEEPALEGISPEPDQPVVAEEDSFKASDVPRQLAAGMARDFLTSVGGSIEQTADARTLDDPSKIYMAQAMMMSGGRAGPSFIQPPKIVRDLTEEYTPQKRAEMRQEQYEYAGQLREDAQKMSDKMGVSKSFQNSTPGDVVLGIGGLLVQIPTAGLTYQFNAYSQSVARAEEKYGKKYSEFTEEEREATIPAHLASAAGGLILNRIGMRAVGAVGKRFMNGKGMLDGNAVGRIFTAMLTEGTEEAAEALLFEGMAKIFYDQGTDLFSREMVAEYIDNFILGALVGGTFRTSVEGGSFVGKKVLGINDDGDIDPKGVINIGQVQLDPKTRSNLITQPRIRATYETEDGQSNSVVIFANSDQEAQEVLNKELEKTGEVLSSNPVVYETIVGPESSQQESDPEQEYEPGVVPTGLDPDTSSAIDGIVRDLIDVEGEQFLDDKVAETELILGPTAAEYMLQEGQRYARYRLAQDGLEAEGIDVTEARADTDKANAARTQEEARRRQLNQFRAGRKLIKLQDKRKSLEIKSRKIAHKIDEVSFDILQGNITKEEAKNIKDDLLNQQSKIDSQLSAIDSSIETQKPLVTEGIKKIQDKKRKAKGTAQKVFDKTLKPVTEVLGNASGRVKGLFRNWERQVSGRVLTIQERLKDGYNKFSALKKKNPARYRELVRLITLDPDDPAGREAADQQADLDQAQDQEQSQQEGQPIPVGQVNVDGFNEPGQSNTETNGTILDQFGNVINEGTMLPTTNPEPTQSQAPIPGIKGAKLPKQLRGGNVTIGRVRAVFESDVDRALYIAGNRKSKSWEKYRDWLVNTLGISKKDVDEMSRELMAKTKLAGKQALKNGQTEMFINASERLVQSPKPDNYLAELSETARNAFNFVRVAFPNVDIIVGGTLAETRANIVQTLKGKVGLKQATQIADSFTDMDNGQAVFVGNKPVAIIVNDATANSTTVAHETWELILNQAFKNDPKRLKELQQSIDKQLRDSGFGLLADQLKGFSDQYDGDIRYSEYLAEFGAILIDGGFNPDALNTQQKGVLAQVKKIINGFSRVLVGKQMFLADASADNVMEMFVNVASKVARGETDIAIEQQEAQSEFDLGDNINTRSQLDPRLTIPAEPNVPKSEILQKSAGQRGEAVMKKANILMDKYPNALTDRNQWVALMSRMTGTRIEDPKTGEITVPRFPEGLSKLTSVEGVLNALTEVSPEQRRLASEGLKGGEAIRNMFENGEFTQAEAAQYFLWNILSIGISPYPQESAFMHVMENGIIDFIDSAVDGTFLTGEMVETMVPKKEKGKTIRDKNGDPIMVPGEIDSGLLNYYNWIDKTLTKGLPGSGAKSNLRSFGSSFLSKAALEVKKGEFAGKTRMEGLYELLADKDTPTLELRKKWQNFATGMSFNNKIFDFILLTTGRQDLYVIDRVRTEDFWDATMLREEIGLKEDSSIYDGAELVRGKSKAAGYSKILDNISGMVINEIAVRQTRTAVQEAYEQLGVTESADVGRFHWETWVATSGQEVSHGSIDAIVQIKKYGDIKRGAVREGKYGKWDFNFEYIKERGKPDRFEFIDNDGNTYVFKFDTAKKIQDEITEQNNKKNYNPEHRFILKDKNGNIIKRKTDKTKNFTLTKAWYDHDGVDAQAYFSYLESQAEEVVPSSNVIDDQGIVVKRQRNYNTPVEGVTYVNEDPDEILNVSQDERNQYRNFDSETGLPRTKRKRNYILKPQALQLKELEQELAKNPGNRILEARVKAARERYRRLAGLVPGSTEVVMPVTLFTELPYVPTLKQVSYSLNKNKTKLGYNPILGVNTQIEDGTPVSLRLDIPAYDNFDTWVVAVHDASREQGDSIAYAPFARITNVNFFSIPDAAINIASGKAKSTIARMHGSFVNDNRDNIIKDAEAFLADGSWTQIGMNPERASYFYNKATGKPVISADEVIQVGALVLAKNAVTVNPDNPRVYQRFNPDAKVRIRFQKKTTTIDPKKRAQLIARRDKLLREEGLYDWFHKDVREVLNALYDEAQSRGMELDYLRDYFPRKIEDFEGLKKTLGITDSQSDTIISLINKQRESKGLPPLNPNDRAVALENYIRRNMNSLPAGAKVPGNLKPRDVDLITDEMLDYYQDPVQALSNYVIDMVTAIETRKLVGTQKFDGERITGTLGLQMERMRQVGDLSDQDMSDITNIVSGIFGRKKTENIGLQDLRTLTYLGLLNDVSSTMTQLKDLAMSFYRYGVFNTVRATMDDKISLEDIGKAGNKITAEIDAAPERFLSKSLNFVHSKMTGFRQLDAKMKTTALNAGYRKMQKAARSNPDSTAYKKLVSKLKFTQGDQYVSTIAALKADTKNDYVMEALYNELADVQPIGRLEMPELYNASPNSRIFYSLKSFAIVHFSFFRQETLNKIATPGSRKEGFENLLKFMVALLMVGIPVDALKDWLFGRPFYIQDAIVNNMLQTMMLNKYTVENFRTEGPLNSAAGFIAPALTSIYNGIDSSIRSGKPSSFLRNLPWKDFYYFRFTEAGREQVRERKQFKAFEKGQFPVPPPGQNIGTIPPKDPYEFNPEQFQRPDIDPRLMDGRFRLF
jgi:hypothetical protein